MVYLTPPGLSNRFTAPPHREKAKQALVKDQTTNPQLPYQLDVINEDSTGDVRAHRERSPAMWSGSIPSVRRQSECVCVCVCVCVRACDHLLIIQLRL